ncbi:MAG: preprotein translocase subunit YajC [Ruminococcus sp.]|nr:preprotein translocase subunit YajC [Ruminococcus sp.]
MTAFADDASETANAAQQSTGSVFTTLVLPLVIVFALMYFMLIRPQKKQEQELKNMQQSIEVGDEIVTRDGIIGMVVRIGKDSIVVETGGDRNKIRLKTWAVAENVTAKERAAAAPKKDNNPLAAAGLSDESGSKKSKKKKDNSEE